MKSHECAATKTCSRCGEAKPQTEFRKKCGRCNACYKQYQAEWYKKNRETALQKIKAYQKSPQGRRHAAKRYAVKSEEIQERRREFYRNNPEARGRFLRYQASYYEENKHMFLARFAKRRARKMAATPKWADRRAIAEIYRQAREITKATGIQHHVDHDIPLKGRNVCGLHVEANLRVIPATDNHRKFNRFVG